jgi:serine/threonine-protein kinase
VWAALLLALCVAGGAAAALIGDNGNAGNSSASRSTAAANRAAASHQPAKPKKTTPKATAPATSTPTAPTTPGTGAAAADNRSAAVLNNTGFAMLPGNPAGALPLIQQAVDKFRTQGDTSSVDYAYSLYNLGWALRLAGRPADAIPYLQERLRISNYKRGVVEQELRTAQQAAGQTPAGGDSAKKPNGNGDGQGNGNGNGNGNNNG